MALSLEDQLRERLRKVEALYMGATSAGERVAAGAAAERLKAKLAEESSRAKPEEMMFTLPDRWSVHLFIALCRRYGFRPYRRPRQRRTTIMVRAPRDVFNRMVWDPFIDLHGVMEDHFETAMEQLIRKAVHGDTADAGSSS